MRPTWTRLAAITASLLALITFLMVAPTPAPADNSHWGANYFPNVILTDQNGKKVKFYDDLLKGKIVVVDLIYTSCQYACPLETARLAQVQKILGDRVGKDIYFYSISIDPEHDTPKVLKSYAQKFHAGPGWLFLTGKKEDIELVSKKLGLYSNPDPENKDGHTPFVVLGNEATGQWIRNSATDNARFLATLIGDWLNSWQTAKKGQSYENVPQLAIKSRGQYIFATHCAACHTVGHGDNIGPDLLGVTNVRQRDWLMRFIERPDKMLAAKDPIAVALFKKYKRVAMPNLALSEPEVAALVDFLQAQTAAAGGEKSTKGSAGAGR